MAWQLDWAKKRYLYPYTSQWLIFSIHVANHYFAFAIATMMVYYFADSVAVDDYLNDENVHVQHPPLEMLKRTNSKNHPLSMTNHPIASSRFADQVVNLNYLSRITTWMISVPFVSVVGVVTVEERKWLCGLEESWRMVEQVVVVAAEEVEEGRV